MVTLKQVRKFYKKKAQIAKTIRKTIGKKETIHGAKAINAQVKKYLRRQTTDYDVFSHTPKKDARQAEKRLDKMYGGDYFKVKAGKHKGTFKVVSRIDKKTYADFTKPTQKIPHRKLQGKRYASLAYFKAHIKKTLKDPANKFRRDKDIDALNRIRVHQKWR